MKIIHAASRNNSSGEAVLLFRRSSLKRCFFPRGLGVAKSIQKYEIQLVLWTPKSTADPRILPKKSFEHFHRFGFRIGLTCLELLLNSDNYHLVLLLQDKGVKTV